MSIQQGLGIASCVCLPWPIILHRESIRRTCDSYLHQAKRCQSFPVYRQPPHVVVALRNVFGCNAHKHVVAIAISYSISCSD